MNGINSGMHGSTRQRWTRQSAYRRSNDGRRLLVLLFMLAVVILLMIEAGKPKNWRWMFDAEREDNIPTSDEPWSLFPGITESQLNQIRDDSTFRPQEENIWYEWIQLLSNARAEQIDQASIGQVGYLQLDSQTPAYRGRIVSIEGVARRANFISLPDNPANIAGLWRVWIFTNNVRKAPIVVYALQLPEGFPRGMRLDQVVRCQALVYKRWVYTAGQGPAIAPLVLAKTITWEPPVDQSDSDGINQAVSLSQLLWPSIFLITILGVSCGLLVWLARSRRKLNRNSRLPDSIELPE